MPLAIRQYSIAVAPDSLCSNGLLASTLAREPLSSGEFKRKHSRHHPRTGTQPACRPSGFGFHGGPKPHRRRSLSHGGIHSTKDERSGRLRGLCLPGGRRNDHSSPMPEYYQDKARLSDERTCWRCGLVHRLPSGNDCCRGRNRNCADRGRNGRSFVGVGLADDQILIGSALCKTR